MARVLSVLHYTESVGVPFSKHNSTPYDFRNPIDNQKVETADPETHTSKCSLLGPLII